MAKLIFTEGKHAGRVYNLVLEKTTVGRVDQNTLVIQDSSLSSKHCEILVNGPEVIVRDLGSSNGTFVNGARLNNQQAQLKSGQTVRFGSVEARLELDEPSIDDTASEETAVFAMRRSLRDKRREEKKPKLPDASVTFESDTDSSLSEHTVILPKPSPRADMTTPLMPPSAERPRQRTAWIWILLAAAALALGLAFFLRRFWAGK